LPSCLSAHPSLSIPALDAFQLQLTPFNSTPTFACIERPLEYDARPGDAVFIPEGWWHQVDSEIGTSAVNYWWRSDFSRRLNDDNAAYFARKALESLVAAEKKRAMRERIDAMREELKADDSLLDLMTKADVRAKAALYISLSDAHESALREEEGGEPAEVRSIHWSPYDRVGVVNAVP
jgi:hypothetical protein